MRDTRIHGETLTLWPLHVLPHFAPQMTQGSGVINFHLYSDDYPELGGAK